MKRVLLSIGLLVALGLPQRALAQFSDVSPTMLDLVLAAGEMTTETVSLTIHPLCIRPIDVDVVASDPGALVVNQTGILVNGCGGDRILFDVQITGTGAAQAFDLLFVDAEFGGVLDAIPVTITPPGPPLPSGPVLSCFFECKEGKGPGTWREVTTLMLANPSDEAVGAGIAFLDGNQNVIASSRLELSGGDLDEVYVCRSLDAGGVKPPSAGRIEVFLLEDVGGADGWIKNLLGKFPKRLPEPFDGRVTGVAKIECRDVSPEATTAAEVARKVEAANPPAVDALLIEGTDDR